MGRGRRSTLRPLTPRRALTLLVVAAVAYASSQVTCGKQSHLEELTLAQAHDRQLSDVMIQSEGRVKLVLGDDTRGSRHQHLLVEVPEGFTVKIAHNIDLATRVPAVVGETLEFRGVYEFNEKGGVVHWTHRDPDGKHPGGWIRHKGRVYE
jgi:hypothetical protein